ncbi:MAG: FAD-dependent oxidoreductase, partial [Eggerthella lenta]
MEQFDAAIIGFGTAGLALGGALADDGQNIVVVEQSDTMYGGACVNNACIPTKALVESARLTAAVGGSIVEREERYTAAVDDMKELRSASRERNYRALADRENVDVIDGRASFANATHLTVATASGTRSIEAKRIFIDTGSLPKLPSIPGIDSPRVFVSSSLIELPTLPRQLVIIGGGYVGLEFASFYTDFGA